MMSLVLGGSVVSLSGRKRTSESGHNLAMHQLLSAVSARVQSGGVGRGCYMPGPILRGGKEPDRCAVELALQLLVKTDSVCSRFLG